MVCCRSFWYCIPICLKTLPTISSESSLMMCCGSFWYCIPICLKTLPNIFLCVSINGVLKKFVTNIPICVNTLPNISWCAAEVPGSSTVDFGWFVEFGEHQNFPCFKLIEIVILWVYYTIPLTSACFGTFLVIAFQLFILHVWLRITDEGSVPEMRIWSIS